MSRAILTLALLACSCGSKAPAAPAAHVIRSMELNEGKPSHISFESAYAKGEIEIAVDVKIGYQSVTVTPDSAGASKTLITVDGKALDFDGPELLIGGEKAGGLKGEVHLEISSRGVVFHDLPTPR